MPSPQECTSAAGESNQVGCAAVLFPPMSSATCSVSTHPPALVLTVKQFKELPLKWQKSDPENKLTSSFFFAEKF